MIIRSTIPNSNCFFLAVTPKKKLEQQLLVLEGLEQAVREIHTPKEKKQLEEAVGSLKAM